VVVVVVAVAVAIVVGDWIVVAVAVVVVFAGVFVGVVGANVGIEEEGMNAAMMVSSTEEMQRSWCCPFGHSRFASTSKSGDSIYFGDGVFASVSKSWSRLCDASWCGTYDDWHESSWTRSGTR
jgi:hypothetical protein